ncbi:MAG: hypothetical protein RR505_03710, partial [Raoultibacter sp.]
MDEIYLNSMHCDDVALSKEASWRKKSHEEKSVDKVLVQDYLDQGFEIIKESVRKASISRPWDHDKLLENRVWTLFYKLGYSEISAGHAFNVKIEQKNEEPIYRQIDVLAKDDETVIVTECRSCQKPERKNLQKDIEEFASLKGSISQAIKKHYGKSAVKLKIIWMIVTSNVIWSSHDKALVEEEKIRVITEKELRYYMQIAEHLRSAARYQFLAEFLKDQKIPAMERVSVPAIKGRLGGRSFYSF